MKEIVITGKEDGERLDRMLRRYLPGAGTGFLYRMIRKKNITVNDTRADAAMRLREGDTVRLWFSEETLAQMSRKDSEQYPYQPLDILYEDADVLFVNKPAGMLSQKAVPSDISLCEYLIGYMLHENKMSEQQLRLFRPSVCNRLDRGTSGLVACGISIKGLQQLSLTIRERSVRKFYRTLAAGHMKEPRRLDGWLLKDEASNTVHISEKKEEGARKIVTVYTPLKTGRTGSVDWTYLEVELITGRSHQIRAHLASIGHPLLGDRRYGNRRINALLESRYGVRDQLLHACRMEFPQSLENSAEQSSGAVSSLAGRKIYAPVPELFQTVMDGRSPK